MAENLGSLAKTIRKLREKCHLTQVQLAQELGITPTSVHRYETRATSPDVPTLRKLHGFAVNRKFFKAADTFLNELLGRMGLDREEWSKLEKSRIRQGRPGILDPAQRSPLNEAVRYFRAALGDTREEFAARTGFPLSRIEAFENNLPLTEEILTKLACAARQTRFLSFAKVFETTSSPEDCLVLGKQLSVHEFAATQDLLRTAVKLLKPADVRRARIALSLLRSDSDVVLDSIEDILTDELQITGSLVELVVGEMMGDPKRAQMRQTIEALAEQGPLYIPIKRIPEKVPE